MSRRLWPSWRRPRAVVSDVMREAGEHVAAIITSTTRTAGRAVALGVLAGIIAGAALVWLGVSIGRQVT